MNPFSQYLEKLLADHLKKRQVAGWYDPRSEFIAFVKALPRQEGPADGVERAMIGGMEVFLAIFTGSFFGLKMEVEHLVTGDHPDPLLIYVPGVPRDPRGSMLMELEKGGIAFDWQLKKLARSCLQEKFSDAAIDRMLTPKKITYADIVAFFDQENGETPSILKTIFHGTSDAAVIIARWLCEPATDNVIRDKDAVSELYASIRIRTGCDPALEKSIETARDKVLRYVLVGEFRDDLSCDPPASLAMIPAPETKDQVQFIRRVAQAMRDTYPDAYAEISSHMEKELGLAHEPVPPEALGRVDTFPFEEKRLLEWVEKLILEGAYERALSIVSERKRSFWADLNLDRQAQWRACGLMAVLGDRILKARDSLPKAGKTPSQWVDIYCKADGWRRVDLAQQQLEAWVAKMTVDPDGESALEKIRQTYEDFIQDMAVRFMGVLEQAGWTIPEVFHQTETYAQVVKAEKTPVAYFLVDAFRFAMADELVKLLPNAREMAVKPAMAAAPTITPVGMAALLPGAESGFSVVESGGRLCARIDDAVLPDAAARLKFFKSRVPDMVDLPLEKLLQMSSKKLRDTVSKTSLLLVRSQEIDTLGEMGGGLIARQIMDNMVGNVVRAVQRIADCGISRFVITADHGHLFTRKKEDAYKTDAPGGKTLELHRRCWVGYGGVTPAGAVRLAASEFGYNGSLEFVFPKGIGVFKSGGDLGFHHGGLSLQELIVPVISFKLSQEKQTTGPKGEIILSGAPENLTNRTFGIELEISGLFKEASYTLRPILLSKGTIVGKAGMVLDGDYDQDTGCVTIHQTKKASVAMVLENEDCKKVILIIQDPKTDAVLAQSNEIPVKLGTR
jgi:hypothetical protein